MSDKMNFPKPISKAKMSSFIARDPSIKIDYLTNNCCELLLFDGLSRITKYEVLHITELAELLS